MFGDRISVAVDGAQISGAGPNSMDAPLSYAPVALLESLTINRGIAPVSTAQETIGGYVQAKTYSGEFGDLEAFEFTGRTYIGTQTVNEGVVRAAFAMTNRHHLIRGLMNESASDLNFGRGNNASEYERERFDLGSASAGVSIHLPWISRGITPEMQAPLPCQWTFFPLTVTCSERGIATPARPGH